MLCVCETDQVNNIWGSSSLWSSKNHEIHGTPCNASVTASNISCDVIFIYLFIYILQ